MQTKQGFSLSTLRAAQLFIVEHAEELPDIASNGAMTQLGDIVSELTVMVGDQAANTIGGELATQRVALLRHLLMRDHIRPLVRIARAQRSDVVRQQLDPFRMPRSNLPVPILVANVNGMV